jgi:PAS domain-containing protein
MKDDKKKEHIKETEELWQISQIIQGSSVAMFVIDKNHRILYWNIACENLTGVPAKRMLGKDMHWSAFYKEKRPVMADLIVEGANDAEIEKFYEGKSRKSSVLRGAYEAERFFKNLGKEGTWLFFTAAPLNNEKGEIVGALETLQDTTERKKAEEEMKKLNQDLKSKIEDLEKLNKIAVGRELKMIELKKRIEELEKNKG